MSEKKILIITYYWPPSGGSGVQRWLKFVKYLPERGYTPYVFTPENPSFDLKDESLLRDVPPEAEVIHFPIWEPYSLFRKVSKVAERKSVDKPDRAIPTSGQSFFQRVSVWLRGNLIIPDPRVFWVRPSVKFLNDFLKDNHIRTIITTGPPHSVHLIGLRLKKHNPTLKWIADFRDPWSEWGLLDSLRVGSVARRIHRRLEKEVLSRADAVTTITPFYTRHFQKLSGRKVDLLTNGFDESDFTLLAPVRTGKFIIRHVGIVNEKCDPRPFMLAVKRLMLEDAEVRSAIEVQYVGEVHPKFRAFVEADGELKKVTRFIPSVPHKQLVDLYNHSALLLLILTGYKDAEGYMPGKLFEYLAVGLPVLGVGPENGDASDLLNESRAGVMIESLNQQKQVEVLKNYFESWKSSPTPVIKRSSMADYSRRAVTGKLVDLLERLAKH